MAKSDEILSQARELLLKARIYRFFGLCFAVVGLAVFFVLYFQYVEGSFSEVLESPKIVVIMLVPFLPAAVISWLSRRAERKVVKLMSQADQSPSNNK